MLRFHWNSLFLLSAIILIIVWIGLPIPIAWNLSDSLSNIQLESITKWIWLVPYYENNIPVQLILELKKFQSEEFGTSIYFFCCILLLLGRMCFDFKNSILYEIICLLSVGILIILIFFSASQIGFGFIFLCLSFIFIARELYTDFTGTNNQRRINREPLRYQAEYKFFFLGMILIFICFPFRTGILPWYYIKHNLLEYYLWGGGEVNQLQVSINIINWNSLYFIFLWSLIFFSGWIIINLSKPKIAFRHVKKSLKMVIFFCLFFFGHFILISIISSIEAHVIRPGPIPFILSVILGYLVYDYRNQFVIRRRISIPKDTVEGKEDKKEINKSNSKSDSIEIDEESEEYYES